MDNLREHFEGVQTHIVKAIKKLGIASMGIDERDTRQESLEQLAMALECLDLARDASTQNRVDHGPAGKQPESPSESAGGHSPGGGMHITPDDVVMVPAGALLDYFFECGSTPGSSISVGEHICWSELGFQADVLNLVRSYRQLAGRLPAAELLDASPDRIVAALAKRADGLRVLTAELQKVEGGAA